MSVGRNFVHFPTVIALLFIDFIFVADNTVNVSVVTVKIYILCLFLYSNNIKSGKNQAINIETYLREKSFKGECTEHDTLTSHSARNHPSAHWRPWPDEANMTTPYWGPTQDKSQPD